MEAEGSKFTLHLEQVQGQPELNETFSIRTLKLGVVTHTTDPSTQEKEASGMVLETQTNKTSSQISSSPLH